MDDAQGTTRIDGPSRYVMHLDAGGTATLQLNCNRANGSWSAEPGADGASGGFSLGPLAVTRAACLPPSLDQQFVAQAPYLRGYLLRDDRLFLSLMADGGIYAWEPHSQDIVFSATPEPTLEAAILATANDYTRELVNAGGGQPSRYAYSRIDLDGNGQEEVFVYLLGPFFCGSGGCNLQLYSTREGEYVLVNEFPVTRTPVIVSDATSEGWRNFWRLESGGGAPAAYVEERFDGARYVEGDRVAADQERDGTRVLAGRVTFEQGVPLEPSN